MEKLEFILIINMAFNVCFSIIGIDRFLDKKENFRQTWGFLSLICIFLIINTIYFLITKK